MLILYLIPNSTIWPTRLTEILERKISHEHKHDFFLQRIFFLISEFHSVGMFVG